MPNTEERINQRETEYRDPDYEWVKFKKDEEARRRAFTEERINQRETEVLAQPVDPRYVNVASHVSMKRPLELVLESIKERLNRIEDELFEMTERNMKVTRQLYGATGPFETPVRQSVGDLLAYRLDDQRREALTMEKDRLVCAYSILATNEHIA